MMPPEYINTKPFPLVRGPASKPATSMSDEILNKDQVASMLDCEPSTVEEKARNHELPGVKIGRSWLFPRQALMQRLNEMALAKPVPTRPQGIIKKRETLRGPPVLPPLPPLAN